AVRLNLKCARHVGHGTGGAERLAEIDAIEIERVFGLWIVIDADQSKFERDIENVALQGDVLAELEIEAFGKRIRNDTARPLMFKRQLLIFWHRVFRTDIEEVLGLYGEVGEKIIWIAAILVRAAEPLPNRHVAHSRDFADAAFVRDPQRLRGRRLPHE